MTNPYPSSSDEEPDEPQRRRKRRRPNTEAVNVPEPSDSSESEEYDPNSPLHLFSDDDNEEEFVDFPNRDFEWQEPEAKASPPPPCVQPTGRKHLPRTFFSSFLMWNCSNILFVQRTDLLSKVKQKLEKEIHCGKKL